MAQDSSIQWTDATWNPTRGCRRVSPGCEQCYAEKMAYRFNGPGLPYEGLTALGKNGPHWTGAARFVPDALDAPLHWRQSRKIFVDSMSDLFYEGFTDDQIAAVFGIMAACPRHTFQVLTKRPERAMNWFSRISKAAAAINAGRGMSEAAYCLALAQRANQDIGLTRNIGQICAQPWPLSNVWIGVSIEDQKRAAERMPCLVRIPAVIRFVSYEPAIEAVDFQEWLDYRFYRKCEHCHGIGLDDTRCTHCRMVGAAWPAIDWFICGGESGRSARPFDLAWARSVISQAHAGEQCGRRPAVFVKQLGSRAYDSAAPGAVTPDEARLMAIENPPGSIYTPGLCRTHSADPKNGDMDRWPRDLRVREFPAV